MTLRDKSSECVPNLSEFSGNQSNKGMLDMHAKFSLGQQIGRADGLRTCVPKCMQIIHTLDPAACGITKMSKWAPKALYCKVYLRSHCLTYKVSLVSLVLRDLLRTRRGNMLQADSVTCAQRQDSPCKTVQTVLFRKPNCSGNRKQCWTNGV